MKTKTITIIGLSRLGASVALALKQSSLDVTIVGHDRDNGLAREAEKKGVVDKMKWQMSKAAAMADILILAVPISELEQTLQVVGRDVHDHTLVLDLSPGLKGAGLTWAEAYLQQGHYVGAHLVLAAAAMVDGRTGLDTATPDLFRNSIFCVVPSVKADPKAVETAVNLGHLLGAVPYFVDAAEFDSLVQGIETVPGLLAAAMFNAVHKSTGWRDMLRFAGLPFAQTTQPLNASLDVAHLALRHKEATLRWLDSLLEELRQVRHWVYEGEEELLTAMLEKLDIERDRWLHERAQNDWVELKSPEVDAPSMAEHMFGGLARKRGKED